MSKYLEAATTLKRLAVKYEGLLAAAAELEELGSFEQTVAASESRVADLNRQADEINAELLSARQSVDSARENASTIEQRANSLAMSRLADADDRVKEILQAAEEQAANIIGRANDRANSQIVGLDAQIEERKSRIRELDGNFQSLTRSAADKVAELAALDTKIAAAKDQIARLLGN